MGSGNEEKFHHLALTDMKIGESLFCTNLGSQNKKVLILAEPFLPDFNSGCNGGSALFDFYYWAIKVVHNFCPFPENMVFVASWVQEMKKTNFTIQFNSGCNGGSAQFCRFLLLGHQSGPQFLSFSRKHGFCCFMGSGNEEKFHHLVLYKK
jgi:hypothetical protein